MRKTTAEPCMRNEAEVLNEFRLIFTHEKPLVKERTCVFQLQTNMQLLSNQL